MPSVITEQVYVIADNNNARLDIKPSQGLAGFRLRIKHYRAIYEIDDGQLIVTIFNIGSRGDSYK